MAEKPTKRKNYIIDRKFQYRFITSFLLWILIALVLFSAGFGAYYWIRYMAGDNIFSEFIFIQKEVRTYDEDGNVVGSQSEILPPVNRIELILPAILINNLIIIVIVSTIGLFYSHRIAGPAYRMVKDIDRVLEGERGVVVRLRKTDKLKDLAEKLNQLLKKIEKAD